MVRRGLVLFVLGTVVVGGTAQAEEVREFVFRYGFELWGLEPGQVVRLWVPLPYRPLCLQDAPQFQQAQPLWQRLPFPARCTRDPKYGNPILYGELTVPASGRVEVDLPYRIRRRPVHWEQTLRFRLRPSTRRLFLAPSRLVPVGGLPSVFLDPLGDARDEWSLGRQVFDLVRQKLSYRKTGQGWGRGDVLWVCQSRYGNCSDYHSLFLALMRTRGVPAVFQIGFPLPAAPQGTVAGYHCWAWFFPDQGGMIPVDISEADKHPQRAQEFFGRLPADRVAFSVGRDLELEPRQQGPPLNFFIYPYAEVGGKPLPSKHFRMKFSYRELGRSASRTSEQRWGLKGSG